MLDRLPIELVRLIATHLPARSLLSLGGTCRDLRALVDGVEDVGDVGTLTQANLGSFLRWLGANGHRRFHTARAHGVWCSTDDDPSSPPAPAEAALCRGAMRAFPPGLRFLDLQDIGPAPHASHLINMFDTDMFAHLHDLDVLRLSFRPGWQYVLLDGYIVCRTEFSVRNAPNTYLVHPIVADTISLGCTRLLVFLDSFAMCRHMSLDVSGHLGRTCLETLLFMSMLKMETLRVALPSVAAGIPYLRHMDSLRALDVECEDYVLDPADLPVNLESVRARVSGVFGHVRHADAAVAARVPRDTEVVDASGARLWRPTSPPPPPPSS